MKKALAVLVVACFGIAAGSTSFAAGKGFSGHDVKFFKEAASGGMMEVQLGQIAEQKAQSQDVKDFGKRMVTDHGKANDELKAVAQQKGQSMPARMEPKHQKTVDKLSKVSGTDFDKQYMQTMVKDHAEDVSNFRNVGMKTKDPDLNAWVAKTEPVIEDHLKQAREIAQKLGIDVNTAEKKGLKEAEKPKTK